MLSNKIFEWIGFIIVLVSIYANGSFRADGITTGAGINLSVIGIIVGVILAFTFFFMRKFGNKEARNKSVNY
ncbi:hypothetical protein KD050_18365 [Psychrobacillus sp. INOP01]|uniref:hypothetical protein n=1 Tax=Psychrobacillus sp. INOP01 TaxID=2829187 RepID=UPI001BA7D57C|nr:hypothetical protein [Psychrobacillus sp. INOP01]QUG41220.1 hypothetical protein KD050_18365 [Psychrobacillus sp. INOP01]